jgi:CBS domain-containing protein
MKMQKQRGFSMVISRRVIVANENDTALYLAALMAENDIGAVVILKGDKLAGIVSERDIVRRVVAKGASPAKTKVKSFMTTDVISANFEDGLDNIYQSLCHAKFRHLPILYKGKLIGIVSQRDVLYGLKLKKKTD